MGKGKNGGCGGPEETSRNPLEKETKGFRQFYEASREMGEKPSKRKTHYLVDSNVLKGAPGVRTLIQGGRNMSKKNTSKKN